MSLAQTEWVWMNGEAIRWREANVHASGHVLHYGTGVFEGIRCYETVGGPAVFRLQAHLNRLYESAATYEMEIPYGPEELAEAICEIIRRNDFSSCYIRPLVYLDT